MILSQWRKCGLLFLVAVLVVICIPTQHAKAAALITIDSHQDGQSLEPGAAELFGSYSGVYEVELIVNGILVTDVQMDDPNGDDSGTWYYKLDTTRLDGNVEIVLKSKDVVTRYGVWSSWINLHIDNPEANVPVVQITNPEEDILITNDVDIHVTVEGDNPIALVELRVDGGPWLQVPTTQNGYIFPWETEPAGHQLHSLEARATDTLGNIGYSLTNYARTGEDTSMNDHGAGMMMNHNPIGDQPLPDQDRAIWIWENASYPLVIHPNARSILSAMAKDTSTFNQRPITTLYLGIGEYQGVKMLETYRVEVQQFIEWAHEEGFYVQALIAGGTTPPYFGAYSRYRTHAVSELEQVLNYNIASQESARFDGVNLDTEPYILPDFKSAKPSVQIQYLDMLQHLMDRKLASGLSLPIGAAIPRWYDSSADASSIPWNGETKWLSEHIQDTADYISIMNYRDQAEGSAGIIAQALGELAYANAIGKPRSVIVGVETKDIADGGDPETITFHEEGRTYMEQELNKVYAAFLDDPAFGGIAIHHYSSILDLPSEWGPGGYTWQPPSDQVPPSKVDGVTADPFDFQRINLSYNMALDNYAVHEYRIYRGSDAAFEIGPDSYAGTTKGLTYKDSGLLPNTMYYYKITAVDMSGNESLPSDAVWATTSLSTLKPMIISHMTITYSANMALVNIQMTDKDTGLPVSAKVSGRFTHMAGKYVNAVTNASGVFQSQSEAIASPQGEIGFLPRRIMADSYYWASAYDALPYPTVIWGP